MAWDPQQYERFKAERAQPFRDLLALVRRAPGLRVVDLGCGTGETTRTLHDTLGARETLGLDSSAAMLEGAAQYATDGLRFEQGDIATFAPAVPFDLIFSNAALHWLPGHGALLARLRDLLAPHGQLAVQVPHNDAHPSHLAAQEAAGEPEFKRLLAGYLRRSPVLEPAQYSAWLHKLGFAEQHVRLQIHSHLLPSREEVVEWTKGTHLTDYQARLSPEAFARFVERYRALLLPQLEDARPFHFTFERLYLWARLG